MSEQERVSGTVWNWSAPQCTWEVDWPDDLVLGTYYVIDKSGERWYFWNIYPYHGPCSTDKSYVYDQDDMRSSSAGTMLPSAGWAISPSCALATKSPSSASVRRH
jgi:hypothetical protein